MVTLLTDLPMRLSCCCLYVSPFPSFLFFFFFFRIEAAAMISMTNISIYWYSSNAVYSSTRFRDLRDGFHAPPQLHTASLPSRLFPLAPSQPPLASSVAASGRSVLPPPATDRTATGKNNRGASGSLPLAMESNARFQFSLTGSRPCLNPIAIISSSHPIFPMIL